MLKNKYLFCFQSLRCCIYHAVQLSEEIVRKIVIMFFCSLNLIIIYVLGTHNNCLDLKSLLSTHKIQFDGEI